jgi:hypothetical protein
VKKKYEYSGELTKNRIFTATELDLIFRKRAEQDKAVKMPNRTDIEGYKLWNYHSMAFVQEIQHGGFSARRRGDDILVLDDTNAFAYEINQVGRYLKRMSKAHKRFARVSTSKDVDPAVRKRLDSQAAVLSRLVGHTKSFKRRLERNDRSRWDAMEQASRKPAAPKRELSSLADKIARAIQRAA